MTDDATGGNVDRLAALSTKVERESGRLTLLLAICTAANIAVVTFGIYVVWEFLPPIMLSYFMEHMAEINMTWRAYDTSNANSASKNGHAAPAGGATTPGAAAGK